MMDTVEDEFEDYQMMREAGGGGHEILSSLIPQPLGESEMFNKISRSEKKDRNKFQNKIDVHSSGESNQEDFSQFYSPLYHHS
jgi:hypothetical protein